ncbi:hypothetical protein OEA41_003830 [Lepraria neglecta]|uniref:Transmembrane protein n=1 Tax=Lepraria neglecta TaxID=209136 RepID=A0AAE0DJC8_9LECA|nr:hypothetical protein OEA41_003830 [Lepraria neglecta]
MRWTAPTPSKPVRTRSSSARGQQPSYKSVSQDPSQPSLAEHVEDVPAISEQPDLSGPPPHGFRTTAYQTIPSCLIVITGAVTGMIISALVPPDGWDCRHWGKIMILFAWLLSAALDSLLNYLLPLNHGHQTLFFWVTGLKDLLIAIATMGGIITTQIGVFNRCSCYTLWGKTGLALPQMPEVATVLRHRLSTVYPALIFVCVGIQLLLIPLFICVRYRHALRVFLQRDDAKSNAARLWKKRKGTSGLEQGQPKNNDSIELQNSTEDPDDIEDRDSFMEDVLAPLSAAQVEPNASNSRASGMQPPSRSNSNRPAIAEPRRRLTEPYNESDSSMAVPASSFRSRPLDERAFVRKPVPRLPRTQGS